MPKVVASSSRRLRSSSHHEAHPTFSRSSLLLNAPRKVSFEDGHQSSSSFTSSSSSTQVTSSCSTSCSSIASSVCSSKSSLRRKAPSVCLVSLLASEQHRDSCLSPVPSTEQPLDDTPQAPVSPWGHFVDILVPEQEEEQQPGQKRRLGSPLFGGSSWGSDEDNETWSPTFRPLTKRHKHRRSWTSPHPYGLQPRHRRRIRSPQQQPSFLPGFFLEGPPGSLDRTAGTREVEKALRRLQV